MSQNIITSQRHNENIHTNLKSLSVINQLSKTTEIKVQTYCPSNIRKHVRKMQPPQSQHGTHSAIKLLAFPLFQCHVIQRSAHLTSCREVLEASTTLRSVPEGKLLLMERGMMDRKWLKERLAGRLSAGGGDGAAKGGSGRGKMRRKRGGSWTEERPTARARPMRRGTVVTHSWTETQRTGRS